MFYLLFQYGPRICNKRLYIHYTYINNYTKNTKPEKNINYVQL